MPCNSCAKAFSVLRKEKGCPSCGFSYCSNCLCNKAFVPKLNAESKVCLKCKKLLTTSTEDIGKTTIVPPDAYYKRIAGSSNLGDKSKAPDGNPTDNQIQERLMKLKADKSSKKSTDDDIAKRLQNIKRETTSSVSDAEIYARLARLKGVPEIPLETKPVLQTNAPQTEQEQVDDLMKQYLDQTQIDSKYKNEFDSVIDSITNRVLKLKFGEKSNTTGPSRFVPETERNSESDDEEASAMKMIEKIKLQALLHDSENAQNPHEELPFCEICNEDATLRCLGCQYLFCKRCYLEHKDDDDDDCNRYEPYTPPIEKMFQIQ